MSMFVLFVVLRCDCPYLVACTGASVWRAAWGRAGRRLEAAGAKALRRQRRPNIVCVKLCWMVFLMPVPACRPPIDDAVRGGLRTCDPKRDYGGLLLAKHQLSQNFPREH